MPVNISKPSTPVSKQSFIDHLQPDKVAVPAQATVTIEKKQAGDELPKILADQHEVLSIPQVEDKKALFSIAFGASRTFNLGNYESAKVSITLTAPASLDTLNDVYEFATTWVDQKMADAEKELK